MVMMQGMRRTKVRDVELNEYWSGGLSASQSCSAGQPPDQVPARVRESANAATGPHLRNSLMGAIWGGAISTPLRPRRISWYG